MIDFFMALEGTQRISVLLSNKAYRNPFNFAPPGSTDTMDVILGCGRNPKFSMGDSLINPRAAMSVATVPGFSHPFEVIQSQVL